MLRDRFLLYAGHGDIPLPKKLDPGDLQGDFYTPAVARRRAEKIEAEYDWWAILDSNTKKFWMKMVIPRLDPDLGSLREPEFTAFKAD